jgi:hypothetical protein
MTCCSAVVTEESHKSGLLQLNSHRPVAAWDGTAADVDWAVGGLVRVARLDNTRSLATDVGLLPVRAVLTSRVKPTPIAYSDEERVEPAAAASGGLAQKAPHSALVDRSRRFGSHNTTFQQHRRHMERGVCATIGSVARHRQGAVRGVPVVLKAQHVPERPSPGYESTPIRE